MPAHTKYIKGQRKIKSKRSFRDRKPLLSEETKTKVEYVNLKDNGKLFPLWILNNFKKYKIPDLIPTGEDPCKEKKTVGKVLHSYQKIIGEYMDYTSPHKDILIYHGLGSGKTISAINVYNVLYNYTPDWNVFILIKASLEKHPWISELSHWLTDQSMMKNIIFIHYDSPIADKQFLEAVRHTDTSKKSLYIIDEVHNFISNVYSNINSKSGRRAQVIYDHILQDKKENLGTRVVCLSGTPAIHIPFELALLFNLLRPGIFPKSETEFNYIYVSTSGSYPILNPSRKNMFQRRIMGLVSYYFGATPDTYARRTINYIDLPMTDYQEEMYSHFERIEAGFESKKSTRTFGGTSTYRAYTRQASNFVFPHISQKISGENRPRPYKFRIAESVGQLINEGKKAKKIQKILQKNINAVKYLNAINQYLESLDDFLLKKQTEDKNNGYTIADDAEVYIQKYKYDFEEFHKNQIKKSGLYQIMYQCSPKMTMMIFLIFKARGPVLVYSNYVKMEGLEIFKMYLKYFGCFSYFKKKQHMIETVTTILESETATVKSREDTVTKTLKLPSQQWKYVEYHGSIPKEERQLARKEFNDPINKHGNKIKIMLISPAGAEGISLSNISQIHLMEPYWTEVRMTQMIGRGVRHCSHKDLPMDQRHVDIYRYKAIRKSGERSTDQYIEEHAKTMDITLNSFLDAIKEVAIDCELNKAHNMLAHEYRCFQFEEPSVFEKNPSHAYKDDIADDMKFDNGSNSSKAMTARIKVLKIKAVMKIGTIKSGEVIYSDTKNYWYYPKSGVVYDFELHFPIGKVNFDEHNLPVKKESDVYIIDDVIEIPKTKH